MVDMGELEDVISRECGSGTTPEMEVTLSNIMTNLGLAIPRDVDDAIDLYGVLVDELNSRIDQ